MKSYFVSSKLFILTFTILSCSCLSIPRSNKTSGDRLESIIIERSKPLDLSKLPAQEVRSRGLVTATILGKGLPLAIDGIKALIKRDQNKYTVSYKQLKSNMFFYSKPSSLGSLDPQDIQFEGVEVKRYYTPKNKNETMAMRMVFSIAEDEASLYNLINNSLFQLQLEELELNYAKAKIPDAKWYLPWTLIYKNDDKLNLDVNISIFGSWITEQGIIYNNQKLGMAMLNLRDVPLEDPEKLKNFINEHLGKNLDGYFYLVPRSAGSYMSAENKIEKGFGQGIFAVEVNVTESGKKKFINEIIYNNIDALDQIPKAIKFK
ncbi:hypothetical protein Belba_0594 [Belliella baltica DSM 15883]|uniref:Uncharacterized protein n=1 Tax=Belliella baltica (strain DSM 15883 / CIP 108006 / LMG 21964 / BA134) TaxID=866536 RepID=I3Z1Y3_BELBD|nr:hypothetical protein Belba_0594 [Belliella baltica DSM 15883]